MASVQISQELFLDLVKFHMLHDIQSPEELQSLSKTIYQGLEHKLDAMAKRALYTQYKNGATSQEREAARQKYLGMIGLDENFKW